MNLPAVEMDNLSGARYDSPSGQERWVLSIAVSHPQFDEHLAKGQSTIPIVFGIGFDFAGVENSCQDQKTCFRAEGLLQTPPPAVKMVEDPHRLEFLGASKWERPQNSTA